MMIKSLHRGAYLLCIFVLWSLSAWSQNKSIRGNVQDESLKPIAHANVLLKNNLQQIVRYTQTDAEGKFFLNIPDSLSLEQATLEFNCLGYVKQTLQLVVLRNNLQITLKATRIQLEDIKIIKEQITRLGDTLEFDLASFVKPEDRSLGDVLRRVPGIEILESGEIKYNGKSLANFYIDGDDLLGDRYGVGTKAITHSLVQKVQIIQNHQPIKVLKDRVFTDDVALNVVIKEEARLSLSGNAKIGVGLPHQFDGEWNNMLFNKKYKTLNVAKGNNIGQDLAAELTSFSAANPFAGNMSPSSLLLSTGVGGTPPLPKNRYFRNHSASAQINQSFRLSPSYNIRIASSGIWDRNRSDGWTEQQIFTTQDTISYSEDQSSKRTPYATDFLVDLKRNDTSVYLQNQTKFRYSGQSTSAQIIPLTAPLQQRLRHQQYEFNNNLSFIPQLSSRLVLDLASSTNINNNPHQLSIHTSMQNPLNLLDRKAQHVVQRVEIPSWEQKFSASFSLKNKGFTQNYGVHIRHQQQHLKTHLDLFETEGGPVYQDPRAVNALNWQHSEVGGYGRYFWKTQRWENQISLPLSFNRIRYHDKALGLDEKQLPIWFQPQIRTKYMMNAQDFWNASYGYNQQSGGLLGVYRGLILNNYRSLTAFETDLAMQQGHQASLSFHFVRSLQLLFANAGISYSQTTFNNTSTFWIEEEMTKTLSLPLKRHQSSWSAQASVSKFLFWLGATSGVKAQWSSQQFQQYINEAFLPIESRLFSVQPHLEAAIGKKVNLQYQLSSSWNETQRKGEPKGDLPQQKIWQMDQNLHLSYSPHNRLQLRWSGRHLYTERPGFPTVSYFFADFKARLRLPRWKADLEAEILNLANITTFETYQLNSYQSSQSRYVLNGRMGLLRLSIPLP